jgi:hypothetical protein
MPENMQRDKSQVDSDAPRDGNNSAQAKESHLNLHAGKTVTLFAYDWASNKFYQSSATKRL